MNKAFRNAIRDIFTDQGLIIFLILVPLVYPLLYAFIYTGETVREVPVVVVDADGSTRSREFVRRVDATADVRIISHAASMSEAEDYVRRREAYGILQIPADFTERLARMEQTRVGVFIDMSGMLYYKAVLAATTDVSLAMNADIKVERAGNITQREDAITQHPLRYEQVALFNPQSGFASFLIPAVLIILLQQTLLLGVGMEAGTRRERMERSHHFPPTEEFTLDARQLIEDAQTTELPTRSHPRRPQPQHASRRAVRQLLGRSMAFLVIYIPVTFYCLFVVPRLFSLPQIGNPWEILLFALPFLLASIFFAITIGSLPRNRESIILLVVFSSIPMLFLSGVSWPGSAFPWYWKAFSCLVPSTFGVNGFIRLNTMGAHLPEVQHEYLMLWGQVFVYGLLAWWVTRKNELLKISLRSYRNDAEA